MLTRFAMGAALVLAPFSAFAQAAPASSEKSPDQVVCELSGDCGQAQTAGTEQARPENRGFSIARRTAVSAPSPRPVAAAHVVATPAARPALEAGRLTRRARPSTATVTRH